MPRPLADTGLASTLVPAALVPRRVSSALITAAAAAAAPSAAELSSHNPVGGQLSGVGQGERSKEEKRLHLWLRIVDGIHPETGPDRKKACPVALYSPARLIKPRKNCRAARTYWGQSVDVGRS